MRPEPKIVPIYGAARPSEKFRARVRAIHGERVSRRVDQLMEDSIAIEALAGLLKRSVESRVTKDGRVDFRDVAADVIGAMKENQK